MFPGATQMKFEASINVNQDHAPEGTKKKVRMTLSTLSHKHSHVDNVTVILCEGQRMLRKSTPKN